MRTFGSAKELEARRLQAAALLGQGIPPTEVARQIGCSLRSVFYWRKAVKKHGYAGLEAQPHPHRPSRMSQKQKVQFQKALLKGPEAFGYPNQLWTLQRIAAVIEKKFGIKYHPCHVWKILRSLGWSCQKPQRRAKEQNEALAEEWKQENWPKIKRQARRGKKDDHLP